MDRAGPSRVTLLSITIAARGACRRLTHALPALEATPKCGNSSPRSLPTTFAATCNCISSCTLKLHRYVGLDTVPFFFLFYARQGEGPEWSPQDNGFNVDPLTVTYSGLQRNLLCPADCAPRAAGQRAFCSRGHLSCSFAKSKKNR